jgi:hypothetical protein
MVQIFEIMCHKFPKRIIIVIIVIVIIIIITISLPPPPPLPSPPSHLQSLIRKPGLLFIQATRLVPSAGFGFNHYRPKNPEWITENV